MTTWTSALERLPEPKQECWLALWEKVVIRGYLIGDPRLGWMEMPELGSGQGEIPFRLDLVQAWKLVDKPSYEEVVE